MSDVHYYFFYEIQRANGCNLEFILKSRFRNGLSCHKNCFNTIEKGRS